MKIFESNSKKGNSTAKIELEIPISFTLIGKRKHEEYGEIAVEHLRLMIRGILENVSSLARLNQGYDVPIDVDFLEFLGEVGTSLTEAIERVEMDCKNNRFKYESEC